MCTVPSGTNISRSTISPISIYIDITINADIDISIIIIIINSVIANTITSSFIAIGIKFDSAIPKTSSKIKNPAPVAEIVTYRLLLTSREIVLKHIIGEGENIYRVRKNIYT